MRRKGRAILWCMAACLLLSSCGGKDGKNAAQGEAQTGTGTQGNRGAQEGNGTQQGNSAQQENATQQGSQKGSGSTEEHLDLSVSTRQAFDILSSDWETVFRTEGKTHYKPSFLGMQYYQGEPVQLWASSTQPRGTEEFCLDVFLCREDGSAELLLEDISVEYAYQNCYLDGDGNFYLYGYSLLDGQELSVLDSGGVEIYNRKMDGKIVDICQLSNGRVYIVVRDSESDAAQYGLAEQVYFNGVKSAEEVRAIIENRVNLYLGENR